VDRRRRRGGGGRHCSVSVQPDRESLGVEFEVEVEHRERSARRAACSRARAGFQVDLAQARTQRGWRVGAPGRRSASATIASICASSSAAQALHVARPGRAAVVRQVHALRVVREHALHRARSAIGSNWIGVLVGMIQAPARRVELAVRQAEGVAGEEAAAALVPDAMVVARVARRVEELQRRPAKSRIMSSR
jgi:hypothetical protein